MAEVLEIRSYHLKPGTAERFHRVMQEQSLPLLRQAGTDVVRAGPSLDSPDAYLLMRAYRDLAHRERSQVDFYGSAQWLQGPRAAVMACIEHYATVVIDADEGLVAGLRGGAVQAGE